MRSFPWLTDDGWPYPDGEDDAIDDGALEDVDLLSVRLLAGHLLDGLDPLERAAVEGQFGLGGVPERTFSEVGDRLGVAAADVRSALGSGLAKLRVTLA